MSDLTIQYPKMNPEEKARWVADLRSGRFPQTDGWLHKQGDGYCCLGVYAEGAGCEWHPVPSEKGVWPFLNGQLVASYQTNGEGDFTVIDNYLGQVLLDKAGLSAEAQGALAEMNDDGVKFPAIAAWIEENL